MFMIRWARLIATGVVISAVAYYLLGRTIETRRTYPEGKWAVHLDQTGAPPCPESFRGKALEWEFELDHTGGADPWQIKVKDGPTFRGYDDEMNGLYTSDGGNGRFYIATDGAGNYSLSFFPANSEVREGAPCYTQYTGRVPINSVPMQ